MRGDCHVVRGSTFVIGGPPGVGKSRVSVGLAVSGATGADFFGIPVHTRFRTLIIQNENGSFRLAKEFGDLDCDALDDWVRICSPPPSNGSGSWAMRSGMGRSSRPVNRRRRGNRLTGWCWWGACARPSGG